MKSERRYPARPFVGVGVVVVNDGDVLIVQRGSEPGYGHWSLPGGAVELGETVREAARREVSEECGIEVDIKDVVEVVDSVVRDDQGEVEYHYVLIDMVAHYRRGELRPGSDILDARWLKVPDLPAAGLAELTATVIRKALDRIAEE